MKRIGMIYYLKYAICNSSMPHNTLSVLFFMSYDINQQLGYSEEAKVDKAVDYDKAKEKEGYIAGKHIDGRMKWWFQR